ncbi:MAG: acetylxylan esterase [Acidobacteriota bacterium]
MIRVTVCGGKPRVAIQLLFTSRLFILALAVLAFSATFHLQPMAAQSRTELDFVSDLEDFRQVRRMLPDYVNRLAATLLQQRQQTVAALSSPEEVAKRKVYVRERMLRALGGFPERTPLNARVVGRIDREDYAIEKVIFESQPRFYVTANLYLPKAGRAPYPGILYPLGHELGAKAHVTWQVMLESLAKKGYVALAWDTIGQGERVQMFDPDFKDSKVFRSTTEHTIQGIQCLLTGDHLARYTIWDGVRALDYLLSRSEVDSERIACTGNSGGGTHTAYLSALDDRIKVAAPSCYLTSWSKLLETIGPQDAEQVLLPWIEDGLDHGDFVLAFAPKPYLMLSAIRDFFAIEGARATFQEAHGIYKLLGQPERLKMVDADDGHGYSKPRRLAAYDWFARWLKNATDDDPEPQVEPLGEQELFCTDSGQVATSLGGETVHSLNLKRLEQLNRGLPALRQATDLDSFRREVKQRVLALTRFKAPTEAVKWESFGQIQRSGYRIEKIVYRSEPGIRIPSLLFVPESGPQRNPAILYAHGRGKSAEAGPGGDIEELCKAGWVVLAPDLRGMGETFFQDEDQASDFPRYFGDYNTAMTALLVDKPLVGMRMLDISRGIDLLASRPEVDPRQIGGFGVESAAIPLLFTAALDDRLTKLSFDRMLGSYEAVVRHRVHRRIFENVIPGVLRSFDLPEVLASLAPRRVWLVDTSDPLGFRLRANDRDQQLALPKLAFKLAGSEANLRISSRRPHSTVAQVYSSLLR